MRIPIVLVSLACILSFVQSADAQSPPDFTTRLMAFTGAPAGTSASVADIDPQLSINDAGRIAFSGADSSSVGLFLIDNGDVTRVVDFGAGFVINGAALNNAAQPLIASRDRMNGSPPFFFIRAWDSDGLQNFTVIGRSPNDFDSAQLFVDINDSGAVAFPALVNQSTETALMAAFSEPPTELTRFTGIVNVRPQIANTGMVVTRDNANQILGFQFPSGTMTPFGAISDGFVKAGRQPGISPDGNTVAFFGMRAAGEGIFVSAKGAGGQVLLRLAGEGSDGFTDFADDERVGVTSTGALPGTVFGSAAVLGTLNGVTGVYVIEFSISQSGGPPTLGVSARRLVAKIGDPVTWHDPANALSGTVTKTISGIQLYDPINRDGSVAFYATFQDGSEGVVRAEGDRDGDGLLDVWETAGIDADGDGLVDLNLAALGANPFHKTVFVEVDAMNGHAPDPISLGQVQSAFANAPASQVNNPDLLDGIDVFAFIDETTIGSLPLPNALADSDAIKAQFFGTLLQRQNANAVNILAAKKLAFHYCLFVDTIFGKATTGEAEVPGNDFLVALGAPKWATHMATYGRLNVEAGTFMHELGHNLGLSHGGLDALMYKPNYHSVMNYYWQFPNAKNDVFWSLGYSQTPLNTLDESALTESPGIGGDPSIMTLVGPLPTRLVPEGGTADFDGIPLTAGPYAQNINDIDASDPQPPNEKLVGYADWPLLRFDFRNTVDFANGSHFTASAQPEIDDQAIDQLEQSCPTPTIYCTAKVNSLGCTPVTSFSGSTSLSGPDDFVVHVDNVLNRRRGVILWSKKSILQPFGGGFVCVEGPHVRSLQIASSGGSPPPTKDCSGAFSAPFTHAYMNSKGIQVGDFVFAQCWSRDAGFGGPNDIGLSAGVAFFVCP
ncbi:MAG: hypothetical protein K8S98_02275 [Planctomycetes bacterium]|nr:hypothetical protein [Planctomycetota bacterium]